MQRYPIAYLRRSTADASDPGDVSREAQEAAVRDLATRDGYNGELRVLVDWDRSADESKESKRTGFQAMLRAVQAGEVSVIYAASLDRLYRSLRTFVTLTDAAKAHDVRIVTAREGVLGGDGSPMALAFAEITAVFSTLELRTTKVRAQSALAVRRQRGDYIGRVPYGYRAVRDDAGALVMVTNPDEPLAPIIEAVRDAGSILGGAKLLQARGVPAPEGGKVWGSTTLRRIIERHAPELIPSAGPTGRRTPSRSSMLAQLLVCHCGHVLTPEPARKAYRCTRGNRVGREAHGTMWVSERSLLPWIMAEAAHHDLNAVLERDADTERRATLEATIGRLTTAYVNGGLAEDDYLRDLASTKAQIADLDAADAAQILPIAIDWTWPPEAINRGLTALWRSVQLDSELRPISADWRVKEWRA